LPGSRLRSRGQVDSDKLSPTERAALDVLFDRPPTASPSPDAFVYRLTRETAAGTQTVKVAEQHVPAAVQSCVRDELA
jgi:hypothetical protein